MRPDDPTPDDAADDAADDATISDAADGQTPPLASSTKGDEAGARTRLQTRHPREEVRRFRLTIGEGDPSGRSYESSSDRCSLGSHPLNDLVHDDPTVSRFHCEMRLDEHGVRLIDL